MYAYAASYDKTRVIDIHLTYFRCFDCLSRKKSLAQACVKVARSR